MNNITDFFHLWSVVYMFAAVVSHDYSQTLQTLIRCIEWKFAWKFYVKVEIEKKDGSSHFRILDSGRKVCFNSLLQSFPWNCVSRNVCCCFNTYTWHFLNSRGLASLRFYYYDFWHLEAVRARCISYHLSVGFFNLSTWGEKSNL